MCLSHFFRSAGAPVFAGIQRFITWMFHQPMTAMTVVRDSKAAERQAIKGPAGGHCPAGGAFCCICQTGSYSVCDADSGKAAIRLRVQPR